MKYVILVGGGYGAYIVSCATPEAAEEQRRAKAQWERAPARLRPASPEEIATGNASHCANHPLFKVRQGLRFACDCGQCDGS